MVDRIKEPELEALIADVEYHTFGTMTVCVLTLLSGFKLAGTSACLNPDDYSTTIGQQVARAKAFDRLWELEGYHRLARASEAA